jgi:hypothetical protein
VSASGWPPSAAVKPTSLNPRSLHGQQQAEGGRGEVSQRSVSLCCVVCLE